MNGHHEIERTLLIHTAADDAFPLFGPIGERAWAPGWEPRVLWSDGDGDRAGMIFRNGGTEPVWVTLRFDREQRAAEYIHFTPDLVTRICVDVAATDPHTSSAHVRYAWTALTPAGEEHVADRRANFAEALRSWEPAINAALAKDRAT